MQNMEVIEKSKREDKIHFKKFILKTIVQLLGGGIVGFFMGWLVGYLIKHRKTIDSYGIVHQLQVQSGSFFRLLVLVIAVCCTATLAFCYWKAKRRIAECDMEDEKQCDAVEKILTIGISFSSVSLMVLLLCFGMGVGSLSDTKNMSELYLMLWSAAALLGYFALSCFFQNRFLRMTKEMYPEKEGSIYDKKFEKKWMQSCDEAEKFMIYQVSYNTLTIMDRVYGAAATIFLFLSMMFGISSLIFLTIMVFWMISQGVYLYACAKIEKNLVQ
ncbi:MAG: DUF3169 family protein [Lachnospiraceae bacterium]